MPCASCAKDKKEKKWLYPWSSSSCIFAASSLFCSDAISCKKLFATGWFSGVKSWVALKSVVWIKNPLAFKMGSKSSFQRFSVFLTFNDSMMHHVNWFSNCTLFENHLKCLIWILTFWHFPPIFVLLKLTCLVTLFDHKLHVFAKTRQIEPFLASWINCCPLKM